MNDALSRRDFIASTAALSAAASLPAAAPAPAAAAAPAAAPQVGPSLIHLFLPGGWPCNDLWDPKPLAPYRPGMRASELTSTAHTISTASPWVRLSALLYHTAHVMDRGMIIRSLTSDSQSTDHATAQREMLDALSFDLPVEEIEPDRSVTYGMSQALLQATRSAAQGQRHIRVTMPFEAYQGFDAHESGPDKSRDIIKTLDMVTAAIVHTLEHTGQLDRTIFCISSEFSRTIAGCPASGSDRNTGENLTIDSPNDYGFHAHFAQANSLILFGGPFKRGTTFGKTAPKHPMSVAQNPVTLANLHATLAFALQTPSRMGQPIRELFA